MYKLAKIDRRANSSFKKKNIYIYIILFIFIYLYINTVLVEREFVHSSSEELYISFFSTASRDLCLIGFAFKAAVFETAVSQTSVYDIYVVSIRHELSFPYTISSLFFFLHFILSKEKWESSCDSRSFPLSTSLTSYLAVIRCRFYSFTPWSRNIRRNVLKLRFKRSDTGFGIGSSIRQSTRSMWPDDGNRVKWRSSGSMERTWRSSCTPLVNSPPRIQFPRIWCPRGNIGRLSLSLAEVHPNPPENYTFSFFWILGKDLCLQILIFLQFQLQNWMSVNCKMNM